MDCFKPFKILSFVRDDLSPIFRYNTDINKRFQKYDGIRGYFERMEVPCGKCQACLANKRQQWIFRLQQEYKHATTAAFCTVTYAPEHVYLNENGVMSVNKRDFQLFMKRLRKRLGNGLRFFAISEYGDSAVGTHRPHYHFLLFNYPPMEFLRLALIINEEWKHHDKWFQLDKVAEPVEDPRITYCAGYAINAQRAPKGADPNFMLCSRRPAIGAAYLSEAVRKFHYDTTSCYNKSSHGTFALHRYYREKIFDDDCKERLKKQHEEYVKQKNLKEYGHENFNPVWTDTQVLDNGYTQEEYEKLLKSFNEKRQQFIERFERKRIKKHSIIK